MSSLANLFLQPDHPLHRQYEALRAIHVEGLSAEEAAKRFGYHKGSLYNLAAKFRKDPSIHFSREVRPGPKPKAKKPRALRRTERIVELRKQENLSAREIQERLATEGIPAGISTFARTVKQAGLPRLWRRTNKEREERRARRAPAADGRKLNLQRRSFETRFGGLFLFAFDLARLEMESMLKEHAMPGSDRLPAGCAFRALLALKLRGIGRPHHIMPDVLDEGLALFAGLNVIPKRSTLSEYSCRAFCRHSWTAGITGSRHTTRSSEAAPPSDLDFHTIPYHGDRALVEKHYVSRRSRRQRGILAFLALDADARRFAYANVRVRKDTQNAEILHFVERWRARTGQLPKELVFGNRLTTYANLGKLHEMGIHFLTLHRRTARLIAAPRIHEERVQLRDYPETIRQIAITHLGHGKPTLLLTYDATSPAAQLIDRYARRKLIENNISDAINFFHMDALSAAVPLKIDVDLQLTLMASALYRMLARRIGGNHARSKIRTLFRDYVDTAATVTVSDAEIVMQLGRRANNGSLFYAGYREMSEAIPWLRNRRLRIDFA